MKNLDSEKLGIFLRKKFWRGGV